MCPATRLRLRLSSWPAPQSWSSRIASYPGNSAFGVVILLAGIPVYLYWRRKRSCARRDFMRHRHSDYMQWAKLHSKARYNLATSGVGAFPLRELGCTIDQLEINGDSTYGYAPLQHAIAAKCGVDPDCVVAAAGTSMANHLAMAALDRAGRRSADRAPGVRVDCFHGAVFRRGRKALSATRRRTATRSIPRRYVARSLRRRS